MTAPRVIGAVLVASGCFSPSLAPGRPCADGSDCPPGQICDLGEGRCQLSADPGDGGGEPDGSLPAARCGTPSSDSDDFEDPAPHPRWVTYSGAGDQLEFDGALTVLVGRPGAEGGYLSRHTAQMIDASIYVEVEASIDFTHETHFELAHSFFDNGVPPDQATAKASTDLIGFAVRAGHLIPRIVVGGVETAGPTIPYEAERMRYWQIVERAGTLSFETAAVFGEWELQWTVPTPSFASVVRVRLRARNTGGGDTAAVSRFLELSSAAGATTWCPAASITDRFDGTMIDPRWFNSASDGSGCSLTQVDGSVTLLQAGGSAADCWYGLSTPSRLTESEIVLGVDPIDDTGSTHRVYLLAKDARGHFLLLRYESDSSQICARWSDATGVDSGCQAYSATYSAWRIRHVGGIARWGVGVDRATIADFFTANPGVDMDELEVFFGSSTNAPAFPQGSATVTTYNVSE